MKTKKTFCLILLLISMNIENLAQVKQNTSTVKLDDSLVMEAKLTKNEFGTNDPVQLILTIKNVADYQVDLFDPTLDRGFDIEVKNNKGANVSLTKQGRQRKYPDIILGRETIRFESGKELSLKVNLEELFEISGEENYSVSVNVRPYYISSPQKKNQTSSKAVSSNTVKFKLKK